MMIGEAVDEGFRDMILKLKRRERDFGVGSSLQGYRGRECRLGIQ